MSDGVPGANDAATPQAGSVPGEVPVKAGDAALTELPVVGYGRILDGHVVSPPWPGAPIQAIDATLAGRSVVRPRWGLTGSIVSLVLSIVVTYSVGFLYYGLTPNTRGFGAAGIFLTLLVEWTFLAGWPLIASRVKGNGARLDFGLSLGRRDFGPGLAGGLALIAGASVMAAFTTAIFGHFGSNAGTASNDLAKLPTLQLIFMLLAVFVVPVFEELAFRGLLWSALAKRGLNPWLCTAISAVTFAAIHLELVRFAILLVAGFILGFLRQQTGRLGPSIVAHMSLNAMAFAGGGFVLLHM